MIHRRALTLVDILAVVLVLGVAILILLILLPGLGSRGSAPLMASQSNMKHLAFDNANFASSHNDHIAGYGHNPDLIASSGYEPRDALHAAQIEQMLLLRKATGRGDASSHPIGIDAKHTPQHRYLHIPLLEEMTGQQPEPIAASPLDLHLMEFQDNPYAFKKLPGGDPSESFGNWTDTEAVIRWPYASSYQYTVSAWSPDKPDEHGRLAVEPGDDASTLHVRAPERLGGRKMTEIAYPSMKALAYEEFDYTTETGNKAKYFADPDARVNVMFFDSSVRRISASEANPGWDTLRPFDKDARALVRYRPIDTRYFPTYKIGDGFAAPFKWTRGGLLGIDVGGDEIDTAAWRGD